MIENSGTFELLAEIAIAVAGFAGVATAFGGRERNFGIIEKIRLTALFQYSAMVLAGCFILLALDSAEIPAPTTIALASFAVAVALFALAVSAMPRVIRQALSEDSTSSKGALALVIAVYAVTIPLCGINAFVLKAQWPLITVFALLILESLWLFHRLLTLKG
jgi:hypothetical protein